MKPYDTSGMLENEDELESVLRDYFQQEMPPELQELSELSDEEFEVHYQQLRVADKSKPEPVARRGAQRGILISAVSASLLLGLVWAFYPKAPAGPELSSLPASREAEPAILPESLEPVVSDALEMELDTLVTLDHGEAPLELTPEIDDSIRESIDITLYNTELGPVEQRTELSWTNITVENPETGSHVKMSMPELTIDFVPVNKSSLSLIGDEIDGESQQ
jgi:hypothetical protein